ncbi:MAG: PKD domain-containing protein, partial [Ginsengibacter sp.]
LPNCGPPLVVNFTPELNGGTVYKWIFGDGGTSTLPNPTHSFNSIQSYSITLIIINPSGCFDTLRKSDYITYKRPALRINNLPAEGCAPFTTTFSSQLNFKDSITSYSWTFGDGGKATDSTPTHTYINVGVYRVKLTVTTALGCTLSTTRDSGALAGVKPTADFKADQFDVCASVPILFTDLSTGGANAWIWDFGDGKRSNEQNPMHQYMDTGFFSVKLIAKNTGCPDSIIKTNYVHIKPPVPIFTVSLKCDEPLKRSFKNSSIGADDFLWDFGDGSPTTTAKVPPPHVFKDTGVYNVSLTVNNFSNGCSNVFVLPVNVIREKADFVSLSNNVCKGNQSVFTTKGINPDYIKKYEWDFGDGIFDPGNNDTVTHVFQSNGLYNVSLKITDILGCKDSITKLDFTKIEGPTVFFTHPTRGGCLNQEITFIDSSVSDGTHPLVKWIWNYGDGTVTEYSAPPFTHTYSTPGFYSVSLTVFDSNGCLDSLTKDSYFEISVPKADFRTSDTSSCPGKPIQFSTLSTGPQLQYIWDFGDGTTTSSLPNPLHTYAANGVYSIKLSIIDAYGCTDSITKLNFIDITTPRADFSASDSVSECSPFQVIFTNTSTDFRTAFWDFGDGASSVRLDGADHVYTLPGTYIVKLTVTGPGGCTDEKILTILVKGPQGSFTTQNIKGCNSLTTKFEATTKGTTSLLWDFGDGQVLQTRDLTVEHTYTVAGTYYPKLILVSPNCRVPVFGLDTLSVYNVTAAFTQSSLLACNTGIVAFSDSSIADDEIIGYNWTFGDGTFSPEQNPMHTFLTPGTYFVELTITTAFGCTSTYRSTEPIKIVASPQVQISGDSTGCIPASLNFRGELVVADTSAVSWQWDFANGATSTIQQPPTQIYTTAGSYTVSLIATNSSGCKDTALKAVTAYPIPVVTALRDTFVCIGNSVSLQGTGASSYAWSPSTSLSCTNCETTIASPTNNIIYTLTGTSNVGCVASDQLEVIVKKPFSISVSPADSICLGSGVTISATGADLYLWSPVTGLDDPTKSSPFASPVESTNYVVVGSDDKGCFSDTKSVPLSVFPLPTVNVGPDITINIGQSTTIRPQISPDVVNYTWTPTTGITSSSDSAITVKPAVSTEYSLLVTNNGNCKAEDRLTVFVICNNANVYIPNTFSPNKDGVNDWFYPRGTGLFKIRGLKIFNRWGEMVYQKANLTPNQATDGWDGTYKNKTLTPDVFIYQVDIICENGSVLSYKGNIALIR